MTALNHILSEAHRQGLAGSRPPLSADLPHPHKTSGGAKYYIEFSALSQVTTPTKPPRLRCIDNTPPAIEIDAEARGYNRHVGADAPHKRRRARAQTNAAVNTAPAVAAQHLEQKRGDTLLCRLASAPSRNRTENLLIKSQLL